MAKGEQPYIVQTTTGVFCSEHPTLGAAETTAAERNKRAKEMELTTRYEAKERPL